jgi:hypothetical protein
MLKVVYGESTMRKSDVLERNKSFTEGRVDVNYDERQVAPVTKRMDEKSIKSENLYYLIND